MGIYDREYYRREGPGFLSALSRSGQVCKWLIAINVAVFVLQVLAARPPDPGIITDWFVLDTSKVFEGQVWRLLTYAFLHAPTDLLHLVFNMLFLWWFGSELEKIYGSREFLTFYLVAAFLGGVGFQLQAAGASWYAAGTLTQAPMYCLGASGAVTAIMVVYACHFPHHIIYVMFVLPVPIWVLVVFQVVMDSFVLATGARTGTAVTVHLAGAAFGFLYHRYQWRLSPWWTGLLSARRERARPKLRVYRGEDEPGEPVRAAAQGGSVDEQLEAKLDAVLEKVARSGQGSLSESEREILFRASEIYKKRRT